jgi:hypothetical protein
VLLKERIPELLGPTIVPEQGVEIGEPDKDLLLLDVLEERQAQRFDERHDHHCRVDQQCGRQEGGDVPAHWSPFRRGVPVRQSIDGRARHGNATFLVNVIVGRPESARGAIPAVQPLLQLVGRSLGETVPLITLDPVTQNSFSRLGVPRESTWYVGRIVDSHLSRQLRNSFASGLLSSTGVLFRLKKPGKAFE